VESNLALPCEVGLPVWTTKLTTARKDPVLCEVLLVTVEELVPHEVWEYLYQHLLDRCNPPRLDSSPASKLAPTPGRHAWSDTPPKWYVLGRGATVSAWTQAPPSAQASAGMQRLPRRLRHSMLIGHLVRRIDGRPAVRILQIHTRYREEGGEDAVVRAEAQLLTQAGHEVVLHLAQNPSRPAPSAGLLAMSSWNPLAAKELRRVAERVRPDVAHVHNTWYSLSPSVLAALADAGVPTVMTLHNYRLLCANAQLFRNGGPCQDCVGSHPWHGVWHRCYRGSVLTSAAASATIALNRRRSTWERHVALYLTMTHFSKERFVAGGLPDERIWVKPHSVTDPGQRPAPPSTSRAILYVGRLSAEKGLPVLIDAMADLREVDLELLVIGDGPERSALERRAGPRVRFIGRVEPAQVRDQMRRARALAFPSVWYETFGMSVVEAMAAGLPVIASDLGGTREIVGDRAGRLVPPGDAAAWSVALRGLADSGFVDRAGAAGRRRWELRFSPSAVLPMLEEAYRWTARYRRVVS
jgi:glycosyltransferase involved in cell wall biosynthesis